MPALPSPETGSSWRGSAARRLRGVAAWLDGGATGDSGVYGPSSVSGAFSALGASSVSGASSEGTTSVRGFELNGAPEHWVRLLRDAGLAPPVAGPALRPWSRFRRAHQAPQNAPATSPAASAPAPAPAPASQAPPVVGPALRAWERLRGAKQASQVAKSIPISQPGPSFPIPSPPESPAPAPTQPSYAHPSSGNRRPFVPPVPQASLAVRPALRVWIRSKGAEQAPQHIPGEAPPLVGPGVRPLAPRKDAEQAPQRMPVLRLRPARSRSLLAAPTNVAGPVVRDSSTPKRAEQAPQRIPNEAPPVAGPAVRDSGAPKRAEQAPQRSPEPQGHPSAVRNHTPASPTRGTWPELTPRPAHTLKNTQSAPLTPLENAISRQTRLHDEQAAL